MNILFLQDDYPPYAKGGAGIIAASLARELVRQGHTVTVVTAVQERSAAGSFEEEGLRIRRIYSPKYAERWRAWISLYNPYTVGAVKRILQEVRPQIVHAHNVHYHLSYHTLKLAKCSGARVVLTTHDVMSFHYGKLPNTGSLVVSPWQQIRVYRWWYNPFRNRIIKRYLRFVDRIVAVSEALQKALVANAIEPVYVIHNGIDTSPWNASPNVTEALKSRLGLEGKQVMLFSGRLSEEKGGKLAIEVFARVKKKIPSAVLLVVGKDDSYAKTMRAYAQNFGVGADLVFTGWITGEDLKAAYAIGDVVCVLSLYLDPFPTVALEAMASGKPVIVSSFAGVKEAVIDGETGYVVNPYDQKAVIEKVTTLLSDPGHARRFGEAGRRHVTQTFSLEGCVHAYLATAYK